MGFSFVQGTCLPGARTVRANAFEGKSNARAEALFAERPENNRVCHAPRAGIDGDNAARAATD
jgi:hypothetical protein